MDVQLLCLNEFILKNWSTKILIFSYTCLLSILFFHFLSCISLSPLSFIFFSLFLYPYFLLLLFYFHFCHLQLRGMDIVLFILFRVCCSKGFMVFSRFLTIFIFSHFSPFVVFLVRY